MILLAIITNLNHLSITFYQTHILFIIVKVIQTNGDCFYDIEIPHGRIVCHHGDHVQIRTTTVDQTPILDNDIDDSLMDPGVP